MKLSLIATMLLSSVAYAQPSIILAPIDHLYIPEGFDSNDSVEVVVTGAFSNPCYSKNKVDVKVNGEVVDIKVTAISPDHRNLLSERNCPQMTVPFKEVVSIGNLQGGEYDVRVNEGARHALADKMVIHEASSNSVDDSIYAAIEYVEKKSAGEYVLHGLRYSTCMELDQIKVIPNKRDTLSILPIMKRVSENCPMKGVPVAYPVKLDFSGLKMKQPLLHVRTMDGKSVNSIVNLEE